MLGERGSWFKFQPFEGSVRIPMIAAGPGLARGRTEARGVSLMDLLPTFNDLVSDGQPIAPVDPLHGQSMAAMLHGTDTTRGDDVMMEFLGEGVFAPACILRKDGFKYVYCRHDPAMLFDLNTDPDERHNLAGRPEHAARETQLREQVLARWDYPALEQTILASQKRRLFAQQALLQGQWTAWDWQPPADASRRYVRGAVDPNTTATKAKKRFPFVTEVKPHHPRSPTTDLGVTPDPA
jgi:choline-sulfatase